jgi:hypothetical protein
MLHAFDQRLLLSAAAFLRAQPLPILTSIKIPSASARR